ncbi:MAG: ArsC family reductase [Gammaproteobacteria bacterium]|nr:ArsC family reductase [Gammaproteobacteria bacterium]
MTILYAIPNCNTVKKARTWLEENNIEYDFHNYKKQGIDESSLKQWVAEFGWETIINRKGMTWRKLDEDTRNNMNSEKAIAIMLENQSIIKRPLIIHNDRKILGFNEAEYQEFFNG